MEAEYLRRATDENKKKKWVEWEHVSRGYTHCSVCLSLHKRWFSEDEKPMLPQHENFHCTIGEIPPPKAGVTASSECAKAKFEDYIFHPDSKKNKEKKVLFEGWGYAKIDSTWLKDEFEKQAIEKYVLGQYKLGLLNEYGQRISIEIILPRKDKNGFVKVVSGWMVYPDGKIKLATPYAGGK